MALEPVEFSLKSIEVDENYNTKLTQMMAEGWNMVPGMKAVALFPVQRLVRAQPQPDQPQAGFGIVSVDETKIKILRNGQLIDG